MKKLLLIASIGFGVSGLYAEEAQVEQTQEETSKVEATEQDDVAPVEKNCKNDGILDSLDRALKNSGYSLYSTEIPFGGESKRSAKTHDQFGVPMAKRLGEGFLREQVMVEVPLTPEIIHDVMDKAIKEAKTCQTKWYKDITKGELNITEETKAGAAAFIAEALKNKVPYKNIEFLLIRYFKGNLKWDELMAEARAKKTHYGDKKQIPSPSEFGKKLKTLDGDAR